MENKALTYQPQSHLYLSPHRKLLLQLNWKWGDIREATMAKIFFYCFPQHSYSWWMLLTFLKTQSCPVLPLSFAFKFIGWANISILFCSNSSFGKCTYVCVRACMCTVAHSAHTDSTINVDVNFGVNFGSWLVLTLCVRLMAFMGTIRINVNIVMFLVSVIVTWNQGPPRRKNTCMDR